MKLEEAIQTAIEYEEKIRDLYQEACREVNDPTGRRIFQTLADDEQYHLEYLEKRLAEWKETGQIQGEVLKSAVPSKESLRTQMGTLKEHMAKEDRKDEKRMLSKALQVEVETSNFYDRMVRQLPEEGKKLFTMFLEMENRHIDAVQAELDYLSNTGFWLGFKEFDME